MVSQKKTEKERQIAIKKRQLSSIRSSIDLDKKLIMRSRSKRLGSFDKRIAKVASRDLKANRIVEKKLESEIRNLRMKRVR